jgi:serine phosphatase RsbU (regulator of sigma subunit)
MPELVIDSGPLAGTRYSFDEAAVIGRGELVDVRIEDVTISRRHAQIRMAAGAWELVDLGSANGTLLNETRIAQQCALADGDRVTLGQVAMRFVATPAAPAPAPVTTPMPVEQAGGRLFQDLLSRVRLFCDLGMLGAERRSGDDLPQRCLDVLLRSFPRLERAALFLHVPIGDSLTMLAQATRDQRAMQPTAVSPLAREGLKHQAGLLLLDQGERDALTERLRVGQLFGAVAALPIRFGGEAVGALYLDSLKDQGALRRSDIEHLLAAANLIGTHLAPLREPKRDYQVEKHDLTLARRIQQRFLPQAPPSIPGYAIVDDYAAARVIGGDHYDFAVLADGRQAMVVADVSGKALSGALYMARLGAVLRQAAGRTRRATELLNDVNSTLYAELEAGMFVTMLVAVIDPRSGALELASAGHPSPLKRDRIGKVAALEVPAGPPLGAMSEPNYESARHQLLGGEFLLLYTDGLDEAHNTEQQLFGLERVSEVLARATGAKDAIAQLRQELARFVGTEPQSDDLTLLAVQRL